MIVGLIVLLYVAQRKFQTILKMMITQIIVAGDFMDSYVTHSYSHTPAFPAQFITSVYE